ncbi:ribonuclease HI family protein [Gryllotalpicola ginsengisoli]|uniref:ribonuclease HI family protein n=1 Tax=Gryllotalpicola ginsengisoli TaxID=444608 RepID=UPI0003B5C764|nr:ribonuclease HI family protein [Gryllotalpicola ginsengisoli]
MTIVAAADGSALGNPGPAGWAWYVDDGCWASGGWPHGTNNQGELMAVIDLLEQTAAAGLADEPLKVLCDSQYVINTITKWMPGWKRKGWRKADGSPVMNLELVQRLDRLVAGRDVAFEWVKGHAGHSLNEAADLRARAVATAYQRGAEIPTGPGWTKGVTDASGEASPAPVTLPASRDEFGDALPPALFDHLGEEAAESDEDAVVRLERALLRTQVRADPSRVAELLHPEFEEIGSSGRHWDRETTLQTLAEAPESEAELTAVLGVSRVADGALLLLYEATDARGASRRSSLWVQTATGWRLRFHQGTPLADG